MNSMIFGVFENVDNKARSEAIKEIIQNSSPSQAYFLMVIFSVSMAAIGLLLDSVIIVIGSMLVAPVLYPVLGLGMGIAILDLQLTTRSFYTLLQSLVIGLLFATLVGLYFNRGTLDVELISALNSVESYMLYVLVSVIAGLAASFSLAKPELSESLPGVVIAVSLVPPLALAGVAGANLSLELTQDMILLFSSNVAGIAFGSALVFLLMKFSAKHAVAKKIIREEDKEVQKEVKK